MSSAGQLAGGALAPLRGRRGCNFAAHLKMLAGNRLVINDVATGPLKAWNEGHPDAPLRRNDRIVEVKGVRGTPEQLRDMCSGSEPLLLKVEKDRELVRCGHALANNSLSCAIQRVLEYQCVILHACFVM